MLEAGSDNGSGEKLVKCVLCDKGYKRDFYLKMHMKKIHGIEDAVIDELDDLDATDFRPRATSTAEDFTVKQEERDEMGYPMITDKPIEAKRKRARSSSEEEMVENLETAKKAKESRVAMREQMNLERELQMGFDDPEAEENGIPGPSTQEINDGIAQTLRDQENTVVEDPAQFSGNLSDSMLTSGRCQAIIDMDKEIITLKKVVVNKESAIMDMKIRVSEANDQLDAKDRVIKEMREIIKIKNGEIDDLVKEAKEFNDKLKRSPLKEELKANSLKAEVKIRQQANHIRTLEAQAKKMATNSKPEVEKLKRQAQELLTRAEHQAREEMKHLNTIASLRKKIPCGDLPDCEQGKKCAYSHVVKYMKAEVGKMKMIPCVHFLNGRCKFQNEDDCRYAHVWPMGKNGTIELEDDEVFRANPHRDTVTSARSASVMEVSGRTSFSRMASHARQSGSGQSGSGSKPPAKRYKLVEDYESGNSYATDKFPEPVPAQRSSYRDNRKPSNHYQINNNGKNTGNAKGALGKRSSQEAPEPRRGSRGTPRMDSGRYNSPRQSFRERERSSDGQGQWEQVKPRRRESRGSRGAGGKFRW